MERPLERVPLNPRQCGCILAAHAETANTARFLPNMWTHGRFLQKKRDILIGEMTRNTVRAEKKVVQKWIKRLRDTVLRPVVHRFYAFD